MEMNLENDSPALMEQADDALGVSHRALANTQEAARVTSTANKITFESMAEVADYLRAERAALQATLKEQENIVLNLLELSNALTDLRNSLIEEYEIQQQITATMQQDKEPELEPHHQETETVERPTLGNFFKNS